MWLLGWHLMLWRNLACGEEEALCCRCLARTGCPGEVNSCPCSGDMASSQVPSDGGVAAAGREHNAKNPLLLLCFAWCAVLAGRLQTDQQDSSLHEIVPAHATLCFSHAVQHNWLPIVVPVGSLHEAVVPVASFQ